MSPGAERGPDDSTFHQVIAMVDAALDRPPEERQAFLEAECAGAPDLLSRARFLLAAAEAPDGEGVEERIASVVGAAAADVLGSSHPEKIGPYQVLHLLGEGGMGRVYAARQVEPVERDVAVKVIRAGLHAPGLVARFRSERQTLATLKHPNIAKLYDAGTTDDGLPYFVMELIEGEPLTDYCNRKGLGLEERIRLFRILLGAVQHAHMKTIVHRDLKPSNVMVADVDGHPVLKVIDFGVARVASGEPGLTGVVGLGGGMGTIEYMAPERLLGSGRGADTGTDIYSLGVMLFELVTGELPFDRTALREASLPELEKMLHHGSGARASRRAAETVPRRAGDWGLEARSAQRYPRRIRGDLDRIIEMAMAGDPSNRYATVVQLDGDLVNFLEARPVTARPPTWRYRATKLVARNRVAAAGALVALILLIGTSLGFTLRLAQERDRAQREADKAQQIAGVLQSFFQVPDPATTTPGDMTARELLDMGATRIDRELGDQPDLQSALLAVLGRTYDGLGLWDKADEYLSRAVAIQRRIDDPASTELADRLHELGDARANAGRREAAEALLREELDLRLARQGRQDPATARAMSSLASVRRGLGDYDEAEALAREALGVLRASAHPDSLALAATLHNLGFILRLRASLPEAEDAYREALAIRRKLLDPTHPEVIQTLNNLALLMEATGRYDEGEALLREAYEARRARLGEEHPFTLNSLNNLAFMLWRTGQYGRATALFGQAVAIGTRNTPEGSPDLAIMLNNLGVAQRRVGELEASEKNHRASLAMNRRWLGEKHPRVAADMDNLGLTLLALGRPEEAERLHRAALDMRTELLGEDHPDRAISLVALGRARAAQGFYQEGIRLLEEALDIRSRRLRPNHARTAETHHDLGVMRMEAGDLPGAEADLRKAVAIRREALGSDHPDVAESLLALARVIERSGDTEEALGLLSEAREIVARRLDPSDPERVGVEEEVERVRSTRAGGG